jgi:hypothetical protein
MCIESEVDTSVDGWYWSEKENAWFLFINNNGVMAVTAEAMDIEDEGMRHVIEDQLPEHLRPPIRWVPTISDPMKADGVQDVWPIIKRKPGILDAFATGIMTAHEYGMNYKGEN